MTTTRFFSLFWILVFSIISATVSQTEAAQATTVNFASLQAPTANIMIQVKKGLDMVEHLAKGNLRFQIRYGSDSGFSQRQFLGALQKGVLDSALLATSSSAFDHPWLGIFGIPFSAEKFEDRQTIINAVRPMCDKFFEKIGIVPLAYPILDGISPWSVIYSKREIKSLSDFKGMLIRIYDPNSRDTVTALGGTPVNMQKSEVYMALQKGTIDGAVTGASAAEESHYDEVVKYMVKMTVSALPNVITISKIKWDQLSLENQNALREGMKNWEEDYIAWANAPATYESGFKYALSHGMKVLDPPGDVRALFPSMRKKAIEEYLKASGDMGTQALKLVNEALRK